MTYDSSHEMMLIVGSFREFDEICEQILALFCLPAVKPLICGNTKDAVSEKNLKRVVRGSITLTDSIEPLFVVRAKLLGTSPHLWNLCTLAKCAVPC